jgi:hypothetical protein
VSKTYTNSKVAHEKTRINPQDRLSNEMMDSIFQYLDIEAVGAYSLVNKAAQDYSFRFVEHAFKKYEEHSESILKIPLDEIGIFSDTKLPKTLLRTFENWAYPLYHQAFKVLFNRESTISSLYWHVGGEYRHRPKGWHSIYDVATLRLAANDMLLDIEDIEDVESRDWETVAKQIMACQRPEYLLVNDKYKLFKPDPKWDSLPQITPVQYLEELKRSKPPKVIVKAFFYHVNAPQVPRFSEDSRHMHEVLIEMAKENPALIPIAIDLLATGQMLYNRRCLLWMSLIEACTFKLQKHIFNTLIPTGQLDRWDCIIPKALIARGRIEFLESILANVVIPERIPDAYNRLDLIEKAVETMAQREACDDVGEAHVSPYIVRHVVDIQVLDQILNKILAEQIILNQERDDRGNHYTGIYVSDLREQKHRKIISTVLRLISLMIDKEIQSMHKSNPNYLAPAVKEGREKAKNLSSKVLDIIELFRSDEHKDDHLEVLKKFPKDFGSKIRDRMVNLIRSKSHLLSETGQRILEEEIWSCSTSSERLLRKMKGKSVIPKTSAHLSVSARP